METSENENTFRSTPHPYFNSRSKSTFNFLQIYQNTKPEPNSSSVIFQNPTHHTDILSPGYVGYIEVPATNIKPPHYKIHEGNSLIHTVFHSYFPDLSEPNPLVRLSSLKNTKIEMNDLKVSRQLNRPFFHHTPQTLKSF